MRQKYQDRKSITVYVDAEEYEKIVKQAGQGNISEWARAKLFGESVLLLDERGKQDTSRSARIADKAPKELPKPKNLTCPHGIEKGWRCTLCGGLVK